ncbi:MAG: GNAT family N-acetyltransferase [Bacteroidetes bacterium]|nr:GNAT family N-acetyltransferase [Bacteroidota bacterium]
MNNENQKISIKIRQAEINDSKIILDCIRGLAEHVNQLCEVSATEQDIQVSFFDSNSHVKTFIAETEEETVCGFALIYKTFSTFKAKTNFYIEDLYVFPEFRNKGVGFSLFNFIKEYAQKYGAQKIEWYVNNANIGAIDFYKKIGAKRLDYKSIYYMDIQ